MRNNTDPIPVFLFGDSAYPLLPWIMMEFSKGINIQEKSCSVVNFLMYVWQLRIHLVHETHFRCLQLAKDININILPRVLYSCSHIYFELQKEKNPEQSLALAVNFEKQVKPATNNLSFKRILNEKKARDIHNTLALFFFIVFKDLVY